MDLLVGHVEIAAVSVLATADGPVRACSIDAPRPGSAPVGDLLAIDGWVIGRDVAPIAVEIDDANGVRWHVPLDRVRPDVAAAHPDAPVAAASGFLTQIPVSSLKSAPILDLSARFPDGGTAKFATITLNRPEGAAPLAPDPGVAGEPRGASDPRSRAIDGPDFVIIGTQRGGTTSLHRYLGAHPDIVLPATKELHFFSRFFDRGGDWYRRQFPTHLPAPMITGEATPYYLFHPHAARRLHAFAPRTKVIVLLREPVARAYSHYQHEVRSGHEDLPFEEAIAREEERLAGERERMLADEGYDSLPYQQWSYVARGRYAEQLRSWFAHFPRQQVVVLASEALYRDPAATVRQVTDFLGLAPSSLRETSAYNSEPYPPLDPATAAALRGQFLVPNQELRRLVDVALPWAEDEA